MHPFQQQAAGDAEEEANDLIVVGKYRAAILALYPVPPLEAVDDELMMRRGMEQKLFERICLMNDFHPAEKYPAGELEAHRRLAGGPEAERRRAEWELWDRTSPCSRRSEAPAAEASIPAAVAVAVAVAVAEQQQQRQMQQ